MTVAVRLKRPHPRQQQFLESRAKRIVIRAGRRFGKTTGSSILAAQAFLGGHRVLYATPTAEQIGKFWWEITTAFREPIEAGYYKKSEKEHYIIPMHGVTEARIKAKTAWNANTLRGDFADFLILDEYQEMSPDAWGLVGAPMLLDNDGSAIFIYTAAQGKPHATQLFKKAEQRMLEDMEDGLQPRWQVFKFSSHDNPHLSQIALEEITDDMSNMAYRLEILAEDLDDDPRAMWNRELLDKTRVTHFPILSRIVVGVDPPGSSGGECGITAAGVAQKGDDDHGYLLEDASISGSPHTWAAQAVATYHKWQADRIVVERNFGGDMVESTIRAVDPRVPVKLVTASRGKVARAEPVVAFYERNMAHHVGEFPVLEDELCKWFPQPGKGHASPNRLDAMVWAFTDLLLAYTATELSLIEIPM